MLNSIKIIINRYGLFILLSFLLIFSFNQLYTSQIKTISFHSDEMLWPCMGDIFTYFIHGNWTSTRWRMTKYDFTNGPLPRYLYGLGAYLSTNQNIKAFQKQCSTTWPSYVGKTEKDLSQEELNFLYFFRKINIVVAILVLWLFFVFLYINFDIISVLLGTILLGFNHLFSTFAVRAMAEMLLLFFMVLLLVISSLLIRKIEKHQTYLKWVVVFGVVCGMVLMTKPYGTMSIVSILTVWFHKNVSKNTKENIIILLVLSIFTTIVVIYPPFLLNPLNMFNWLIDWFSIQNAFQHYYANIALVNPLERLTAVFQYLIYPGKLSILANIPIVNIGALIIYLVLISTKATAKKLITKDVFIATIFIGFNLFSIFYLYRTWERYFLPLILSYAIMYAYLSNAAIHQLSKNKYLVSRLPTL